MNQKNVKKIRDVASDDDAVNVVEKGGKDPMAKAKRIIEYSKENKSSDNLTAAVIMLWSAPSKPESKKNVKSNRQLSFLIWV